MRRSDDSTAECCAVATANRHSACPEYIPPVKEFYSPCDWDGMSNARPRGAGPRLWWASAGRDDGAMGVAMMMMMAPRLQVDRDREFVRLGLVMLTALAVAVEVVMRW